MNDATVGTERAGVATERPAGADLNPPWTIRNMPTVDRDAAAAAAKRAQKTVAEWLGEAIRGHIETERRGNGASYAAPDIRPARGDEGRPASYGVHTEAEGLCRLAEAAARVTETAEKMPKGLRASLTRGLREAARQHEPPPRKRQAGEQVKQLQSDQEAA